MTAGDAYPGITSAQAKVVTAAGWFRELAKAAGATSLHLARRRLPGDYDEMLDHVEITVAEPPLRRLQTIGAAEASFPLPLRDGLAELQAERCFYCNLPAFRQIDQAVRRHTSDIRTRCRPSSP